MADNQIIHMTAFEQQGKDYIRTNDMNQITIWEDGDLEGPALNIYTPEGTVALDHYATIQLYSMLKRRDAELNKKVIVIK